MHIYAEVDPTEFGRAHAQAAALGSMAFLALLSLRVCNYCFARIAVSCLVSALQRILDECHWCICMLGIK